MIQIAKPTVQYTNGGTHAHVQFQRRSPTSGEWVRMSYSPTQAQLAARAPTAITAAVPGYWGDAEVEADLLQHLSDEFGMTNAVIV